MSADFVRHIKQNRGKVSLSVLLIVSLLAAVGVFFVTQNNRASAAAITSASDTLNNSAPGATSTHTITFTTPTGVAANATMTITFPSGFATSGVDFTDMDLKDDGGDVTLADTPSGTTWGATTSGDIVVTFTNGSTVVDAGSVIEIQIGDNADSGDQSFTNPSKSAGVGTADIHTITIGGGFGDSGDILVATIESVTVSITIDESLAFSITGVTNASCDTIFGADNAGPDTTTSTVPYADDTTNVFHHGCHELEISTNASSGYVLTNEINQSLRTSAGVLINNGTCDGTCTETATDTWVTASGNNGFAYACDGTDCDMVANTAYRTFACTGATTTFCLPGGGETAQTYASNGSPVNTSTTTIEYKLSLSGTQAAGTYSNTVTYIATPTF